MKLPVLDPAQTDTLAVTLKSISEECKKLVNTSHGLEMFTEIEKELKRRVERVEIYHDEFFEYPVTRFLKDQLLNLEIVREEHEWLLAKLFEIHDELRVLVK